MRFPGIHERGRGIYTENAYPGLRHFEEHIRKEQDLELREIMPDRSKLAAAIKKGISQIGIKQGNTVLYLGASHGYTPSFMSDMVGKEGTIFAIEFAPRVARDLYFLAKERKNIIPILADCNHPERYQHLITACDIVYQDIAQRNQLEIFLKNLLYLKKGGFGLLAIKARSIDVTAKPIVIFKDILKELEKSVRVVDYRELEPFEMDHAFFVIKK